MTNSLKEKLAAEADSSGGVSLSSGDVADFVKPDADERSFTETEGTVASPPPVRKDAMLDTAAQAGGPIADNQGPNTQTAMLPDYSVLKDKVDITQDDRDAFLDAVVSGDRYTRSFALYNGRVTGVLRSRSQQESRAVINYLATKLRDDKMTQVEYANMLRNCMLVAQIAELQGEEHVPMAEPLMAQRKGEQVTPPGWLKQFEYWDKKSDSLVEALFQEIQRFETKYWVMVEHSDDQDFWQPVGSISE